jgi:hypothetical protein
VKIKTNFSLAPETNFEVRRLSKLWGISVSETWARCCHYAAARFNRLSPDDMPIKNAAELRQAEAKVEMLKGTEGSFRG